MSLSEDALSGLETLAATMPEDVVNFYEGDGPNVLLGNRGLIWCRIAASPKHNAELIGAFMVRCFRWVPALVAEVRRLRAENQRLAAELRDYQSAAEVEARLADEFNEAAGDLGDELEEVTAERDALAARLRDIESAWGIRP